MRLTDRGIIVLCLVWIAVVLFIAVKWYPDLLAY